MYDLIALMRRASLSDRQDLEDGRKLSLHTFVQRNYHKKHPQEISDRFQDWLHFVMNDQSKA